MYFKMEYKDYYKILGVDRDISQSELKKSYRKLARKYHPDVSKEKDAEERFKEVNEAYEVLGDENNRAQYDSLGSNWKNGQNFNQSAGGGFDFNQFGVTSSSLCLVVVVLKLVIKGLISLLKNLLRKSCIVMLI